MTAGAPAIAGRSATLDHCSGPAQGPYSAFIDRLEHPVLRETLHAYRPESDTQHLSVAENYLLGMVVLCAQRNYGPPRCSPDNRCTSTCRAAS
jgi:hypothetical protein